MLNLLKNILNSQNSQSDDNNKKDLELLEFLFNYYLSNYQLDKACSYTKLMTSDLDSKKLDKYKIFCHLRNKEFEIALSKLELGIQNKR